MSRRSKPRKSMHINKNIKPVMSSIAKGKVNYYTTNSTTKTDRFERMKGEILAQNADFRAQHKSSMSFNNDKIGRTTNFKTKSPSNYPPRVGSALSSSKKQKQRRSSRSSNRAKIGKQLERIYNNEERI